MTTSTCPACGVGFIPVRRQRYCSQACRHSVYRRRQPATPSALHTTAFPAPRRDHTVYLCIDCEQRYLGQQ